MHGLTARLTLWANEDSGQFQALLVALLDRFAPANDVEFLCVEEMAMAKWRLRRVVSVETAAGNKHLAGDHFDGRGRHAGGIYGGAAGGTVTDDAKAA